jgi:PAT family beta-lactamase induction signal transducer AmpG
MASCLKYLYGDAEHVSPATMQAIRPLLQIFQSQRMMALLLLGFFSGLPLFLTSRTLQLWMQDAKVNLGAITLFGLVSLPYSLKFVWSPLLDRFAPPFLGPRRSWLVLTQIGLVIAIALMALQQPAQDLRVLQLLAVNCLIITFLSATQDIAGDAYRTDVLKPLELETGASLWVLGYRVALFATSSLAIVLADYLPWNVVYLLIAGLMAAGIATTLWAPEPPRQSPINRSASLSIQDGLILVTIIALVSGLLGWVMTDSCLDSQISCRPYETRLFQFYWVLAALLVGWVTIAFLFPRSQQNTEQLENRPPDSLQDAIILPLQEFLYRFGLTKASLILVFILLYKLGDALVGITANLFLRDIGFSKTEIGALQGGMGFIATTVGVLIGGIILARIGVNRALWIFGALQLASNLGYYVLATGGKNYSFLVLAINLENVCAGLVTVVTVAYLMSLCSHNFTTTQFALFSSLMAIGRDVLSAPAGELAKLTGWSSFFLLSIVAALPGMLLLPVLAPWNAQPLLRSDSELGDENPAEEL